MLFKITNKKNIDDYSTTSVTMDILESNIQISFFDTVSNNIVTYRSTEINNKLDIEFI